MRELKWPKCGRLSPAQVVHAGATLCLTATARNRPNPQRKSKCRGCGHQYRLWAKEAGGGLLCFGICTNQPHKTFPKKTLLSWQLHPFWKGFVRLTGAIPKQSNSTVQIQPPPWLNLRRKPELDLLPLELDFLYGLTLLPLVIGNTHFPIHSHSSLQMIRHDRGSFYSSLVSR